MAAESGYQLSVRSCVCFVDRRVLKFVLDIRKGHYIVAEYVDKVTNRHCPNHPWQVRFPLSSHNPSSNLALCPCSTRYASSLPHPLQTHQLTNTFKFAESQVTSKAKLPQVIQAVISSLASPESEMTPNTLVLVAHGISGDLRRLEEMKISELADVFSICFAFLFLFSFLSLSLSFLFHFLFLYLPLPLFVSPPLFPLAFLIPLPFPFSFLLLFLFHQRQTNTNPPPPLEIPNNVLIIDTSVYERVLYKTGHRGLMPDPKTGKTRDQGMTLSLENLLLSFTIPMLRASSPAPSGTEEQTQTSTPSDGPAQAQQQQQQPQIAQLPVVLPQCTMHNAGNDAMLCLFALQKLLEPAGTRVPSVKKGRVGRPGAGQQLQQQQQLGNTAGVYVNGMGGAMGMNGMVAMNGMNGMVAMNGMAMNGMGMGMNMGMVPMPMLSPMMTGNSLMPVPMSPGGSHGQQHKRGGSGSYDLAGEFGQMGLGAGRGMSRSYTTGQFLTAGAAENGRDHGEERGEREKDKGGSWGRAVGAGRGRR